MYQNLVFAFFSNSIYKHYLFKKYYGSKYCCWCWSMNFNSSLGLKTNKNLGLISPIIQSIKIPTVCQVGKTLTAKSKLFILSIINFSARVAVSLGDKILESLTPGDCNKDQIEICKFSPPPSLSLPYWDSALSFASISGHTICYKNTRS